MKASCFILGKKPAVLRCPTAGGARGVKPKMFFPPQMPTMKPETQFCNRELSHNSSANHYMQPCSGLPPAQGFLGTSCCFLLCHPRERLGVDLAGKDPHRNVEFDGLPFLEAQIQFWSLIGVLSLSGQLALLPHPSARIK